MSFTIRLLLILLILLAVEFYFIKKITGSLKIIRPSFSKRKIRTSVAIGTAVFNLYPVVGILFWIYARTTQNSNITAPENWALDYFIIFPFWIIALIIVQSIIYLLPLDLSKILLYPVYRKYKETVRKYESLFILLTVCFFTVYVPVRVIYDFNSASVRPVKYYKENLPEELEGFKITFIADVQVDRFTNGERLERFIEKTNSTNPDLVLIAGDVITGTPKYIEASAEALGKLKSKYGVYSCVGDHDNWAYRYDTPRSRHEIKSALIKQGVQMIDDESIVINAGDSSQIGISFITYTYSKKIDPLVLDSLTESFSGEDVKIFLTHQQRPHLITKAVDKKYDLILTGHTHGGQLTFLFPFFNPSVTHIETNYVKGDFWFDKTLMIVTRGLGMSLAPLRYNSTPEVTAIILTGMSD